MSRQVKTAFFVALRRIFDILGNDLCQLFNGVAGRRVVNVASNVALGLQVIFELAHGSASPPDAVKENNGVGHVKCRGSVDGQDLDVSSTSFLALTTVQPVHAA